MKCLRCQKNIQIHNKSFLNNEHHQVCYYRTLKELQKEYEEIKIQTHQQEMLEKHQNEKYYFRGLYNFTIYF
jgi:hypothetical protein